MSLGASFWLVYRRAPLACADGACIGSGTIGLLKSALWEKGLLWIGAALVALTVGANYSASLFFEAFW